jgi:phage N-6-adenine-methyltransferase
MSNNLANHTETRREDWGTPIDLFLTLSCAHRFAVDLCASPASALCSFWVTEAVDIMSPLADEVVELAAGAHRGDRSYAWINPPYRGAGGTGLFVARAAELCQLHGLGLVALVPASVGSRWWRESVDPFFDFVVFTPRLRFEGAPSVAQFDSAICVMRSPGDKDVGPSAEHRMLGAVYKRV